MKKFKLEFTEDQINYILQAIATRPFSECHTLMAEIQAQASSQVDEPQLTVEE